MGSNSKFPIFCLLFLFLNIFSFYTNIIYCSTTSPAESQAELLAAFLKEQNFQIPSFDSSTVTGNETINLAKNSRFKIKIA